MALRLSLCINLFPILVAAAPYQLCFLEDGANSGKFTKEEAQKQQAAHMQHIGSMWKSGALEGAGPVSNLPSSRGIFLFSATAAEANRLASQDPKVQSGDLKLTCHAWNGPSSVGKAYRELQAGPEPKNRMQRRVAVLFPKAPQSPLTGTLASGPITSGGYAHFAVFDTDDLPKIKADFPDAIAFLWFHDTQVWIGVS